MFLYYKNPIKFLIRKGTTKHSYKDATITIPILTAKTIKYLFIIALKLIVFFLIILLIKIKEIFNECKLENEININLESNGENYNLHIKGFEEEEIYFEDYELLGEDEWKGFDRTWRKAGKRDRRYPAGASESGAWQS